MEVHPKRAHSLRGLGVQRVSKSGLDSQQIGFLWLWSVFLKSDRPLEERSEKLRILQSFGDVSKICQVQF